MSMTDVELDALICRALKANLRAEFPGVFNPAAQFPWPQTSPRYRRWERKLLADPAGFVRRQCRPVWQKALRMAACLILCAALALVAVMMASPTARAWVVDRVVTWMETYTQFRFYGQNAQGVTADWCPGRPESMEEKIKSEKRGCGTERSPPGRYLLSDLPLSYSINVTQVSGG